MIKYLGSKRLLIPHILAAVRALPSAATILDLFSGTSRVGHALKAAGYRVLANDHNAYAHTLARCYVETDSDDALPAAAPLIARLNEVAAPAEGAVLAPPPEGGGARRRRAEGATTPTSSTHAPPSSAARSFIRTYSHDSRFFTPANAARIAAVRDEIDRLPLSADLRAVALTSLLEAADRVDSTTGVQMAYLKALAPRARNPLTLRVPALLPRSPHGKGRATRLDALDAAGALDADIAYLDPPYNQHSYLGNYHLWETLTLWDNPEVYGAARKRHDCRTRRSPFNSRLRIRRALADVIRAVRAEVLLVSFSDEGFLSRPEMETLLAARGRVAVHAFDYPRYVGAKIGIYNPRGQKVGRIGRLRNTEHLFVVTPASRTVSVPASIAGTVPAP